MTQLTLSELEKEDLPFLIALWQNPEVVRHADELPWLRGWSKADEPETAWKRYQKRRAESGPAYTQLILRLEGKPIGESFFAPLPEGFTFGRWAKPSGVHCVMGDIKLLPPFWGRGLGTTGMRTVVRWAFGNTPCQLFVVPPHRHNPAAMRVYEKAGFLLFTGMRSWRNHKIMELSRQRFRDVYAR